MISHSCSVQCCRRGAWSDSVRQHHVCCLWLVLHNPSVQHRHTQSTRRSHWRQRNETSTWHGRLPSWSSTVRRRLGLLQWLSVYLASISGWSLVRQVAVDWLNNAQIHHLHPISDVTTSTRDVTLVAVSSSTSVHHDWQTTTAAWRSVATVHVARVSRRWNDTWYVCRRSLGHVTGRVAVGGEWTD